MQRGGYFVLDVGSLEELQGAVSQLPLFPFCDSKLIPLVSLGRAMEPARQALRDKPHPGMVSALREVLSFVG